MGDAGVVAAFASEARTYDEGFGRNPVGLVFRHVFQDRARALFAPGSRILDLGCGTGEDALALAASGLAVEALDPVPAMVERARSKAALLGVSEERCRFHVLAAEELHSLGGGFDGAYSDFGALNCAGLPAVGRALAAALRPGAPVLLSLLGPHPLPDTVRRFLTAEGTRRGEGDPVVGGRAIPVAYPRPSQVQEALGPAFTWHGGFALGVVLPPPDAAAWAEAHPQAFGMLAALEGLVRRAPFLRGLGDHVVLEGRRRDTPADAAP
jgi:SAM-dependent methyltransferase